MRLESRRTSRSSEGSSRHGIFKAVIFTHAGWTTICVRAGNPIQLRRALIRSERSRQRCLQQRYGTPETTNPLHTGHTNALLNHRAGKRKGAGNRSTGSRRDEPRSQCPTRGKPAMKLEIALNGKAHQVELAQIGERPRCTIDGTPLEADAVQIAPGIYSILIDGESLEVRVEPDGGGLRVAAADQEWRAEVRDPRVWRRNRSGGSEAEGRERGAGP